MEQPNEDELVEDVDETEEQKVDIDETVEQKSAMKFLASDSDEQQNVSGVINGAKQKPKKKARMLLPQVAMIAKVKD